MLLDYELEALNQAYRLTFQGGDGAPSGLGIQMEKRGPPGSTDCSDPQGYRGQISIPDTIRNSDLPTRICIKLSDKAGNLADPEVFDFGAPAMLPNAVRNAASLRRGTIAPGAAFRLDTFNLTDTTQSSAIPTATLAGVRMQVRDQTGRTLPVLLTTAGPLFLEGVMPLGLAPGPATAIVQPPQGPSLSQKVTISRTAPGLYSGIGTGVSGGFAFDSKGNVFPLVTCSTNQGCTATQLPLSSTPGGLDFVIYGTGFRAGLVRLRIGTHTLMVRVSYHPGSAGVNQLHFHLAQDFPLRLYQAVLADTMEGDSNVFWVYLK